VRVDCIDQGEGPAVVLVHSSVSGNRQWKRLVDDLKSRFRLLAPNLFGYGATPAWDATRSQRLEDHAQLVASVLPEGEVSIVGHSFGGAVAMKLAAMLGRRVSRLVLLETNPFYLLAQNGRAEAFAEIKAVRDHVKEHGARGDWPAVAHRFADYWNGPGSWDAMAPERREAFARAVRPNYDEWDAVMDERTTLAQWDAIRADTLLVSARETVRPIREIGELLQAAFPAWTSARVEHGGHMAPLTRPDLVNPLITGFLTS
jgi:pimeloyl-ACP methyl ester carboxylesterase